MGVKKNAKWIRVTVHDHKYRANPLQAQTEEDECRLTFDLLDTDNDGRLGHAELKQVLHICLPLLCESPCALSRS